MTARGCQRRHLLLPVSAVVLASSAGCSLLYDLNTTQCETTADCRALGEAFANTTCYNRVCVEKTSDAGEGGHGGVADTGGSGMGPAGQGGEAAGAAGTSPECNTNAECIEQRQDQYFVCRNHQCVAVLTNECPELIPESTAQYESALEALKENPILLGAFSTMNATTPHESFSVLNWELALTEFNDKLLGGLPSPSGRRPLMALACQAEQPDIEESMGHLVGDLDVPAILSSLSTADLLAAFELTQPDGLHPVFFMSARSADLRLATLQDNGMLWHMLGNPRVLAVPTVALLERAEPYVNAQRQSYWDDRATTGSADDPGDPLRVMLVYSDDPTVEDIATVLTTDDAERPQNMLVFNGMSAIDPDNAENFGTVKIQSSRMHKSVNVASAIEKAQAFLPHVIIGMATTEFETSVIPQIESNWDDWAPGQQRPFYLLSHMLANDKDDLIQLASETFETVHLGSRMIGVNYAQNPNDALYRSYLTRLQGANPSVDGNLLAGYENYYDAAYYLLYSVAAANRTTYSGADIRDALTERVIFGSEPLDIGPNTIASTVRHFGDDPGFSIKLTGTMGPPNFDRATGTRVNETAAWCIGQPTPGDAWQLMADVVLFDETAKKFEEEPIPCVDGL
ncbi:MAG: hypothetical protein JW940_27665 [Polyangiaceae bacterium]|nr:hypothetical protein [Polyangiaceae bacterium]